MELTTICKGCGREDELRRGFCWDCANNGERKAACRTVLQHMGKALVNARLGRWDYMRCDLKWAISRVFRIGNYKTGGYFDKEGHPWRSK